MSLIRPTVSRRLAVAATLLAIPAAVRAQETRDTASLPEIVVTATRYPLAPDSVAATVTVLRGEDLRAQGIRFVSEALRQVPSAQVVQSGSYGGATSLFVRGGESDYVKVLVDGIPLNQPGGTYDFASLTTDNVERIEILRGPGSVLYGSDAIAGVVQIITRGGQGGLALDAAGSGGTFGSAEWLLGGQGGAGGPRLVGLGLAAHDRRHLRIQQRLPEHRGERPGERRSRLAHQRGAHRPLYRRKVSLPHRLHRRADRRQPVQRRGDAHAGPRRRPTASPRRSKASCSSGRNSSDADFVNPPDPPATSGSSNSRTETERRTAEARAQIRLPRGVRGLAGIAYDDQHQESTSEFDGFEDTPFEADRDNWGFYLQASALVLPRLQLTAGGRLDENERFGSFWTYRASALAFASPTTRLRASVGTGFKEPTFFENYSTSFTRGNPDLQPERSFSVEAGIEQDLAEGKVGLSLTGFVQRFRDLIQFNPVTATPEDPNFFNIAAADASGVEAIVRVRPLPVLEGSVSYTWLDTEVTDAGFETGDVVDLRRGRAPAPSAHQCDHAERAVRRRGAAPAGRGRQLRGRSRRHPVRPVPRPLRPGRAAVLYHGGSERPLRGAAGRSARAVRPRRHGAGREPVRRGVRAGRGVSVARPRDLRRPRDACALSGASSSLGAAARTPPGRCTSCGTIRRSRSSGC